MKTANKRTKKIKTIRCKKGGKVLTSGGFGCLFKPALKCKNILNYDQKNTVTKLMTKKHARDEYNQVNAFKAILDHIPNYRNYFLVDGFKICQPVELTKEDLEDFDDKCDALKKKTFTAANINQNLSKILALNMPDGGVDVDDYVLSITEPKKVQKVYTDLNNSLVDLLVNGIGPMNKAQLYHCDVKGSNILVRQSDPTLPSGLTTDDSLGSDHLMSRLIDWGLSIYKKDTSGIPDKLDRRPFQFNVPFSVILFNKKFLGKYRKFLENSGDDINYYAIREFVINYIFYWNKIRGAGHLKTINSIVKHLSFNELSAIESNKVKNHIIEYEFTYYYIVEYISKILFKYTVKDNNTNKNHLNLLEYFNQIFLKNIDVWGLTMLYMVFLDHIQEVYETNNTNMNASHKQFIQKIKYIIIHFLFETPTEVININKLASELHSLNGMVAKFNEPGKTNDTVNYFESLKNIDTSHLKEFGGSIHKKNNSIKTIKKGRTNRRRTNRRH
jgi:phage FluMu protein Com